jgi:hypothetical protein
VQRRVSHPSERTTRPRPQTYVGKPGP